MTDSPCADNINILYNNQFKLVFGRGTKQMELMCQKANLPGIRIGEQVQPTTLGTTIPVPSLAVTHEPLNVEFLVDSNLYNWKTLYSWIRNISNIADDRTYNEFELTPSQIREMERNREAENGFIKTRQELKKHELHWELARFYINLETLKSSMDAPLAQCPLCSVFGPEHTNPSFPRTHARHHCGPVRSTYIHSLKYMINAGIWADFEGLIRDGLLS